MFAKASLPRRAALTSVGVVKVDELLPLVMAEETENRPAQAGPHLDDELHVSVDGEAGRDEGGVQRPAEGGQRVHGLPVVEAEDGVNSSGELRADWRQRQNTGSGQGERSPALPQVREEERLSNKVEGQVKNSKVTRKLEGCNSFT